VLVEPVMTAKALGLAPGDVARLGLVGHKTCQCRDRSLDQKAVVCPEQIRGRRRGCGRCRADGTGKALEELGVRHRVAELIRQVGGHKVTGRPFRQAGDEPLQKPREIAFEMAILPSVGSQLGDRYLSTLPPPIERVIEEPTVSHHLINGHAQIGCAHGGTLAGGGRSPLRSEFVPTLNYLQVLADTAEKLVTKRCRLPADELAELAGLPDAAVPSLAALAHEVRLAWCGPEVELEGILSAKTGGCPEDCHFCAQSAQFDTPVLATPFLDRDQVLAAARETAAMGASEFCLVLAVRGPDERTLRRILELVPLVRDQTGLNVAVSAGILDPVQAQRLADSGVHRYNHNLETARSFFDQVVTTHTWQQRYQTCQLVKDVGMELCCGVLLGMGETDAQRLELIAQLAELGPTEVPINFLDPRPGTPLAIRRPVRPLDAIRWIALFRLGLPGAILRYAGGREITLRDLQAMGMTAGINALIVGNYLTTLGRAPSDDLAMLADLRMPIGAFNAL
jgi:biotin synthase